MDEFPLIFFSLFLFNKTLLLTNIWVFLATPVCPSSALGSQDGYFQVPCAPGAQHDIVPLLPKLCEAGVQQEGWDGLGRAFCPQFQLQEAVRSLQGFLLAGVRGECAVCWICKQGSRHQRKCSPGRMKSHPEQVPMPVQEHTEQPSSAFPLSLAWLYTQQDSVSLNKS